MGNIIVQLFINNQAYTNRYLDSVPRVGEHVSIGGSTRKVYCVDWDLNSNPAYVRVWLGDKVAEDIK